MFRPSIRFVAALGVVAGAVFAWQLGKAAEPVLGGAASGDAYPSPRPAALSGPAQRFGQDPTVAGVGSRATTARGIFGQSTALSTPDAKPPEKPLTVLKSGPDHVRVVYRLNRPATDTNRVLQQLFGLEGGLHKSAATTVKGPAGSDVAIVPSIIDNSLVISGPPEAVDEIRTLLEKLDQPRGMLLLEMEMGVVPFGEAKPVESPKPEEKTSAVTDKSFRLLQRPAKMETTAHARLITLDNQPAFIQMGSRVPRVTSMSVSSSSGGETRSVTMSNVGLLVGITPRIGLDGAVTMQIDVERSQLGIEKEGIPISVAEGKVIRSPRIDATTVQGTVRIPDAQTVVLGSVAQKGKSDEELVIVITPHVIRPEGMNKAR